MLTELTAVSSVSCQMCCFAEARHPKKECKSKERQSSHYSMLLRQQVMKNCLKVCSSDGWFEKWIWTHVRWCQIKYQWGHSSQSNLNLKDKKYLSLNLQTMLRILFSVVDKQKSGFAPFLNPQIQRGALAPPAPLLSTALLSVQWLWELIM